MTSETIAPIITTLSSGKSTITINVRNDMITRGTVIHGRAVIGE